MQSFEVLLGYESVDRSTFSMKCGRKCALINAFIVLHSVLNITIKGKKNKEINKKL
jgi:hypothetical protein